jgi:hypothetical protein
MVTIQNLIQESLFAMKALISIGVLLTAAAAFAGDGTPVTLPPHHAASPHGDSLKPLVVADIHVTKATGPNAKTVAEIATNGAELKDKPVLVRGQVVKYTPDVMGKNWIHLQDGSGKADNKSNDILVTTTAQAKIGDVLTFKGVVRTDKDFGAGYSYKVLIEEATLQP